MSLIGLVQTILFVLVDSFGLVGEGEKKGKANKSIILGKDDHMDSLRRLSLIKKA